MSMQIFLVLTLFLSLFSGFLIQFGLATPAIASQIQGPINCDINNSPALTCQFPQFRPPTPTNITSSGNSLPWYLCILSTPCVIQVVTGSVGLSSTAQAIWNGLSEIAYGIEYFSVFAYVFFNKLIQGILLLYGITQIMSTDFGILGLQYIFTAFIIFYIVMGISLLKPAGSTSE